MRQLLHTISAFRVVAGVRDPLLPLGGLLSRVLRGMEDGWPLWIVFCTALIVVFVRRLGESLIFCRAILFACNASNDIVAYLLQS